VTRRRFIQQPDGSLKEVHPDTRARPRPPAPAVHEDIQPFVSPVNGAVVGSRRTLREHNRRHDVVQLREYGPDDGKAHFERIRRERDDRLTGQTRRDRQERIEALKHAFDKHRSR
jgi:hypothetical protein